MQENVNKLSKDVDISEHFIDSLSSRVLKILLQDHSKSTSKNYASIFWATNNYKQLGPAYGYYQPITSDLVTGERSTVVQPRFVKNRTIQAVRSKDMAEVFTPSWICNVQNNQIDANWFGRENVFNIQVLPDDGSHRWEPTFEKISFPAEDTKNKSGNAVKDWKSYVQDVRIEITCGEAPYVVSRYDATTGEFIPIERRIGILDRKLRVVGENTVSKEEWLTWAEKAYKSVYGYEWQGDNLWLARKSLLITLFDYFGQKYPDEKLDSVTLENFAEIISWNFWQMDGLKGVIPNSCKEIEECETSLSNKNVVHKIPCEGCSKKNIHKHNGVYCKIKDWQIIDNCAKKIGRTIKFVDTLG